MHKINKKIKYIVTSGLMLAFATSSFVYANEVELKGEIDIYTNEDLGGKEDLPSEGEEDKGDEGQEEDNKDDVVQVVITSISGALEEENVGKEARISATVKSVNGNYITITDGSNEIDILLKIYNDLGKIKEGYKVVIKGVIEKDGADIVISLYDSANIKIEVVEDDKKDELPESSIGDNSKPNTSNKPSQSVTPSVQGGASTSQVSSVKKVYARTNVVISYDLSDSQWNKVKEALEEGSIKVVDLPNNKIRIKKVSNGYGDKVWIVNDPRNLDEELEEKVRNIGLDSMKGLKYSDYDVTESEWNDIIEDIEEGNAKIKILDDGLRVIYTKSSRSDYILEIEKR